MSSLITPSSTGDTDVAHRRHPRRSRRFFPWLVFALTFGLLLSDYMSRQVLSRGLPVPQGRMGADRHPARRAHQRRRADRRAARRPAVPAGRPLGPGPQPSSLMAGLWSLATLGLRGRGQLRADARSPGSSSGSVRPPTAASASPSCSACSRHRCGPRSSGAFMAGGSFGSVHRRRPRRASSPCNFGWRWSFAAMAIFGLVLVVLFWTLVSDRRSSTRYRRRRRRRRRADTATAAPGVRAPISSLFTNPVGASCAYIGSGLQLFIAGSLFAWLPSYFGRAYGLAPDKAAAIAAVVHPAHGRRHDRVRHRSPTGSPAPTPSASGRTAIVYASCRSSCSASGSRLDIGTAQLLLIGVGAFFAAGSAGPAGAMVANLTHASIRATAFGTLTLANNLLGLAAGPFIVGVLADKIGLAHALALAPLVYIPAIAVLLAGKRAYPAGLRKLAALTAAATPPPEPTNEHPAHRDRGDRARPARPRRRALADPARRTATQHPHGRAAAPRQAQPARPRRRPRRRRRRHHRPGDPGRAQRRRDDHRRLGPTPPHPQHRGRVAGHPARPHRGAARRLPHPRAAARQRLVPDTAQPAARSPAIVAASTNDPLCRYDRAATLAQHWGARLVDVGPVGHLNPAAGYGYWPARRGPRSANSPRHHNPDRSPSRPDPPTMAANPATPTSGFAAILVRHWGSSLVDADLRLAARAHLALPTGHMPRSRPRRIGPRTSQMAE